MQPRIVTVCVCLAFTAALNNRAAGTEMQPPEAVLSRVERIPDFAADYSYVALPDRVRLRDGKSGSQSVIGILTPGQKLSRAFKEHLDANPEQATRLGRALTRDNLLFGETIAVAVFEGGALVQERSTKRMWCDLHDMRKLTPRPAGELNRFLEISSFGLRDRIDVTVCRERVIFAHLARGTEEAIPVGKPGHGVSAAVEKVLDKNPKLGPRLGSPVSPDTPLFDGKLHAQVFEGGVIVVDPGTGRSFHVWHERRLPGGAPDAIRLPADPRAIVIRFDFRGGFAPARKTPEPYLVIRADGSVTATDPYRSSRTYSARLTPENLQEFLRFAIKDNDFLDLDTRRLESILQNARKTKRMPYITDQAATIIEIRTAASVHEVRCYALDKAAEYLPLEPEIQRLAAIERRLQRYWTTVVGGP